MVLNEFLIRFFNNSCRSKKIGIGLKYTIWENGISEPIITKPRPHVAVNGISQSDFKATDYRKHLL